MTRDRLRIVVTGLIGQHPRLGGVAWDYVQYPLALAQLGHDVHYLEDSGEWPYVLDGGPTPESWVAPDASASVEHLASVMGMLRLGDRWMYRFGPDGSWHGPAAGRRAEILASADLLINVSGSLEHPERYRDVPCMVYIDSDPVFTQAKVLADPAGVFARRVDAHDVHFTFGETLGDGPFATGHRWRPTRQPVVLSEWVVGAPARAAFTTIMSWTSYRPLQVQGITLGQKDVEFRRFVDLPASTTTPLEVALGSLQHAGWEARDDDDGGDAAAEPADVLRRAGWNVVDALERCATPDDYRDYVTSSRGEWSVAKSGYVTGRSGWFSCRSACYLAAGRPVVVQDTGFGAVLPTGEGIVAFSTPDEARDALAEVSGDYPRHAEAARAIAHEYFGSRNVLTALLDEASASGSGERA